jgi:hypothetical protein
MFRHSSYRIFTALLLTLAVLICSTPISAADFSRSNSVLGSVRVAGTVQVRGVAVTKESTVFPGDRVHTGAKSYAKVTLVNGNRFELLNDTDFVLNRNNQQINVGIAGGAIAFNASKTPVAIRIADYEILPAAGSSGVVGFIGNEFAAVRPMTGSVTLTSLKDKKSTVIGTGVDRFINVSASTSKTPLTELASAAQAPTPLPSRAFPQVNPSGLTHAAWAAILATIAGGAAAVAILATRGDSEEGSPSRP